MKASRLLLLAGALLVTAGCSSVDSRIARNRAIFDTWSFPV